jgi:ADP-heptose:LPS heptosyltransferase
MKILIVQIGRIGDAILTTPMFRAIMEKMPEARIHLLVSRHGFPVVRNNPRLEKIFIYRKDPISLTALLRRLRFERYDWWVDPKDHYSREGSFLVRMGGGKNSIGFNRTSENRFTIGIPSHEEQSALHAVERNLRTLAYLGIQPSNNLIPELFVETHRQQKALLQIGNPDAKRILLNISTGDVSRYWPVEKWVVIARWCISRGYQVLIVSHLKDRKNAAILQSESPDITLFHSPEIDDIIAVMPYVRFVITPDTSIVHIASAFNIPQVALFPDVDWNYRKFRPLSQRCTVLRPVPGGMIRDITCEEVINAIDLLITV